ncbi:hypothetical protein AB0J38_17355 [Streptomyces sp. NPDC050095]|uniref:hypothetical protein n=1 Tax=unclassified Streptomyces TaxID=2593676 RepID=UPI0034180990
MTDSNAALLAALETAWEVVQSRHPDLPAVTFTTGSAVKRDSLRWSVRDSVAAQESTVLVSTDLPELRLADTTLNAGAEAVITALLHQAAHVAAARRGIRDTTNRNKWHNRQFLDVAQEFGLIWPEGASKDTVRGFAEVVITPQAREVYAPLAEPLDEVLKAWKRTAKKAAASAPKPAGRTDTRMCLSCACGRKLYMAKTVYALGGVTCDACGQPFTPGQ